jgi:hypothetical protein
MGPVFVPLLEAVVALTFGIRIRCRTVSDYSWISGTSNICSLCSCDFILKKEKSQWTRPGDYGRWETTAVIFSGRKLLAEHTKNCVSVHNCAKSCSPGSTIIPDFVLDEVPINNVLKHKNIANLLLMFDLTSSLSLHMKKTRVLYCADCWVVTAYPAFISCICTWCSFPNFEAKSFSNEAN